jgi:two-component system NarL family sensor kinase
MPKYIPVFLLLLLTMTWCSGQVPLDERFYLDSLTRKTQTAATDSIKARANLELSQFWAYKDSLKSEKYLAQGKKLAGHSPYLKIIAQYYEAYFIVRTQQNRSEKMYRNVEMQLRAYPAKEANLFRAKAWYEYGIIQFKKDNYDVLTDIVFNKCIPLAEKAENKAFLGTSYLILANIFKNAGQYEKAESYCLKAIGYLKKEKASSGELISAYHTLAENYTQSGQNPKARVILDDIRSLLAPYPESEYLLDYYAAEGLYYTVGDQFKKALANIEKGILLSEKLKIPYKEQRLLLQKFYASYYIKDFEQARSVLQYLMTKPPMMKLSVNRLQLYHGMAITYQGLGEMALAYEWLERYSKLSDSVAQGKLKTEVNALELKYRGTEKQKEINELKANNIQSALAAKNNRLINWLLGSISLILLIVAMFSFLYYRNNRKLLAQKELSYRQHLNELEQQQQLQYSQAMLEGEEQERRRLARDLHDGLGGMLAGAKINLSGQLENPRPENQRENLQKIIGQLDNSVTELRRIAHNMMPENLLNFGLKTALKDLCETLMTGNTKIEFQALEIDGPIPEQTQINIYRIVQEMLANAIRHANASKILLQCSRNIIVFFITQEDNGKGFELSSDHTAQGTGLNNIRNRVGFLKGKIEIESTINEGTVINIELHVD